MVEKIRTERITKDYGSKRILEEISIQIPKGKITTILGKNGAGKTTFIKLLLNMIQASQGKIYYDQKEMSVWGRKLYQKIAAVLESVDNVYDYMTGKENILYFLGLQGLPLARYEEPFVQDLLRQLDLHKHMDKKAGQYSRGMAQKLALVIALITEAETVFLDEPTLGLDFKSSDDICRLVKHLSENEGLTVILTSHQAEVIEKLSDYVLVLDQGRIVYQGAYEQFKDILSDKSYRVVLQIALEDVAGLDDKVRDLGGKVMVQEGQMILELKEEADFTSLVALYPQLLPAMKEYGLVRAGIDQILEWVYQGGHHVF